MTGTNAGEPWAPGLGGGVRGGSDFTTSYIEGPPQRDL